MAIKIQVTNISKLSSYRNIIIIKFDDIKGDHLFTGIDGFCNENAQWLARFKTQEYIPHILYNKIQDL